MAGMTRYFPDPRDARKGTRVSAEGMANTVSATQRSIHGPGVKRMAGHMIVSGKSGRDSNATRGKESKLAKFDSLNSDGNTMEVYLRDRIADDWEEETTTVYKPYELQAQFYDGLTHTYADGTTRSFSASG